MNSCFIGLGSNLGNRKEHLEKALQKLAKLSASTLRVSPAYENAAMVPPGAPSEWALPYLNAVAQIQWTGPAADLLARLKQIEREMGRAGAPRWSPRIIDLDLLLFGLEVLHENQLRVPHPGVGERSFVLDPLKDLAPMLKLPGDSAPVVLQARKLPGHSPWIMGIVNLTPDSFSDGGELLEPAAFEAKIQAMAEAGVHALDLGAESTRPGAAEVSIEEEWGRLSRAFSFLRDCFNGVYLKPVLSVDTRRAEIAERAIERGANLINDVSGLSDPRMIQVIKESACDYVLMHSLSVPADPTLTFAEGVDPIRELKQWLARKLEFLERESIDLNRIIFDPGIGFGKTAEQSLEILNRFSEFSDLPVRFLVGHSRKSFLKAMGIDGRERRDSATLEWSRKLARAGVDILRVHEFEGHCKMALG